MSPDAYHLPVMLQEVESYLITNKDGSYVDCTLGGGGHSEYLLEKYPGVKMIGIDRDEDSVSFAAGRLSRFGGRIKIVRGNFKDLKAILSDSGISGADGVLADLGVSSHQLDEPGRGFSFASPNLDMRMDRSSGATARELLDSLGEEELADLIYKLGEERFSRRIARRICEQRLKGGITTGEALADIVARAKPGRGKINPATKVFQALRIAVNRELENLSEFINSLPSALNPGGRAVTMSYHSLEDRIIKQGFKKMQAEGLLTILTKKVVCALPEEQKSNPRSRSAKLRCAERA